jgi:hypothetical protein
MAEEGSYLGQIFLSMDRKNICMGGFGNDPKLVIPVAAGTS